MTAVIHVAAIAFFATWAAVTLVKQFRTRWARAVGRHDPFSLVPLWTFFAPNPGRSDLHLLFRDRLGDGTLSDWIELESAQARRLRSSVWHPEKHRTKAVHDAVSSIGMLRARHVGPEIMASGAYLMLLSLVCAANGLPDARQRQFVVVATEQTAPDKQPKLRLKSPFHPL
jgi:hypothetical protein